MARIDATDGTKVTLPAGGSVQVESKVAATPAKTSPPSSSVKSTPKPTTSQPVASSEVKPVSGPQPTGNFALEFDGVDDLVELPSLAIDSNNPFTCEVYITPHSVLKESDPEWRGYVIMGPFSIDVRWIAKVGTSHLYVVRKGYVVGPPIESHRKVHVAACFDGNSLQLFVDGHSSEVKVTPEKLTSTSKGFRLAASLDSKRSNWNFHGLIDEIRISSKVRYTKDFTPELRFEPDDDTVALYHFDEGTGDILRDSSKNHYDGKIVGAKWVRADGSPINSAPASTGAPPLAKAPLTPLKPRPFNNPGRSIWVRKSRRQTVSA